MNSLASLRHGGTPVASRAARACAGCILGDQPQARRGLPRVVVGGAARMREIALHSARVASAVLPGTGAGLPPRARGAHRAGARPRGCGGRQRKGGAPLRGGVNVGRVIVAARRLAALSRPLSCRRAMSAAGGPPWPPAGAHRPGPVQPRLKGRAPDLSRPWVRRVARRAPYELDRITIGHTGCAGQPKKVPTRCIDRAEVVLLDEPQRGTAPSEAPPSAPRTSAGASRRARSATRRF